MAAAPKKPELIVIVGPTASGKSDLAMKLAQQFNGEIICADSRTIYKGMDIGTAKPSIEDQKLVQHWGLNLVEPGTLYSAKDFKDYALSKIKDISKRHKLPILVGGTGLYIDAVIFDYQFKPKATEDIRQELEAMNIEELRQLIEQKGYEMPENSRNKRRLIRVIETEGAATSKRQAPINGAYLVGLNPSMEELEKRIKKRAQKIFALGATGETKDLVNKYGKENLLKTSGIIYSICVDVIDGKTTESEALKLNQIADRQYAKRQLTWFKRNKHIHWFGDKDKAFKHLKSVLNN